MIELPTRRVLGWQLVLAMREAPGVLSNYEINRRVADALALSEETMYVPHKGRRMTEFDYRCAWARTDLSRNGLVTKKLRLNFWSLTALGQEIGEEQFKEFASAGARTEVQSSN